MSLEESFYQLASRYTGDESLVSKWWEMIVLKFGETWRYYHTLTHVEELLGFFDQYFSMVGCPDAVLFAIWFHDIIYDPKRNDNEELSRDMFHQFWDEIQGEELFGKKIEDYIIATKQHIIPEAYKGDQDLALFLDMDVAILGKEPNGYLSYAFNIRREYIHYPEDAYREGRIKVLESLRAGSIFTTETFKSLFDDQANQNMTREITLLESGEFFNQFNNT
eukprot:TRINITY_DN2341_c0_g1_i1.p1 TRINITY_DN2341_c0_g1~~TRINITY_DN2341_c0_g1_i1.p1  ORF type:complete len:221 (-),score=35.97 TRINITY_DN2341_c0_g1_i1:50-712(-)